LLTILTDGKQKVIEGVGCGIFYYSGFITVGKIDDGWRLTGASLEPENLARNLGGHQPWRSDPKQVALVALTANHEASVSDFGEPVV
jgi:hypothetical protein